MRRFFGRPTGPRVLASRTLAAWVPAARTLAARVLAARVLAVALAVALGGLGAGASAGAALPTVASSRQYSPPNPTSGVGNGITPPSGSGAVSGLLRSPGGPYLRDRFGRVVFLHGVNAVYKYPPYELTVAPGKPWDFSAVDAAAIARLGFNVVRLGILWQGLEPGSGGPNNPAVCAPGTPGDPHMFNPAAAAAYLAQVARVVDLLGRYHVYTLLDMHQDVYNQGFRGEGAPAWAVCTDNQPIVPLAGRWSRNYRNGGQDIAVAHFWNNDVVGNLQGQYDQVWGAVAAYFRTNPWIAGYDPYNEPFALELAASDTLHFAVDLECFYTGRARPGQLADATDHVACPPSDPRLGVIPSILAADPGHLVFVEPDVYSSHGQPSLLGPMDFPNLVLNFHSYCGFRSPVTGDPTNLAACANQQLTTLLNREGERPFLASREQPGGPAWFMSEFGATQSSALLGQLTGYTDLLQVGWAYWSWKYYGDPTGSANEWLASPSGQLAPTAAVLSRTYPQAVAGTPASILFDPGSGTFQLTYAPSRVRAPTSIFVSPLHYPGGHCAVVQGGRIVSAPGATDLQIANDPAAATVSVTVRDGHCPPAP